MFLRPFLEGCDSELMGCLTVGRLWTSQVVCPCQTVGRAFPLEMPAPGWHSDPQVAVDMYLGTQGTPSGRASLGQAYADPDPATQGLRVWLWFSFHSHPACSVFVSQETPGLGRTRAACSLVQQKIVLCSLCYHRRSWLCCDSGKWPKPYSPAWDNGCRLLLTYHERASFWHFCLKREEERGKFSFTVYTILITKCFCTLHLFYSITHTPSHQKLALAT